MWLLTPTGFYSAVTAPDRDQLQVRTRTAEDAERLIDAVFVDADYARIIVRRHADYRHRVLLSREQWADFVAGQAHAIDYGNFKHAVAQRQGHDRARVYADVWAALYRLQSPVGEA